MLTSQRDCGIISKRSQTNGKYGGIAQLARATGSDPVGHGFKSNSRYHFFKIPSQSRWNNGPLVKRLRHGPFTAVTWVRFPYGSPKKETSEQKVRTFPFLVTRGDINRIHRHKLLAICVQRFRFPYGSFCFPCRFNLTLIAKICLQFVCKGSCFAKRNDSYVRYRSLTEFCYAKPRRAGLFFKISILE